MTMMSLMEPFEADPPSPPVLSEDDSSGEQPPTPPVSGPAGWPVWTAPAALVSGLVLALFGGLLVDIPAAILGVDISSSKLPPGLEIADTIVQDAGFVLAAVLFAQIGGRTVKAWHFGLRRTRPGRAMWLGALTLVGFFVFSVLWAEALDVSTKEKLLDQLGANESTLLLVLSAGLTCVVAPICEEFLFRGFVFSALSNWRGWLPAAAITGLLFGGIHVGSAPAVDLVPLAALGFGLCVLYRATGSLYPCIAIHSLNNAIAFGALENWGWQIPVLMVGALATIAGLALGLRRLGVITEAPEPSAVVSTA